MTRRFRVAECGELADGVIDEANTERCVFASFVSVLWIFDKCQFVSRRAPLPVGLQRAVGVVQPIWFGFSASGAQAQQVAVKRHHCLWTVEEPRMTMIHRLVSLELKLACFCIGLHFDENQRFSGV